MLKMHINQMSLILLLSFLYFRQVTVAQVPPLHPDEANVLRQIATTLKITNSTKDPCVSQTLSVTASFSEDHKIICESKDDNLLHVTNLKLKTMSLEGTLPPELVNLTFLEEIDLTRNYLSGELPKQWASMRYLKTISLTANRLSGKIPEEWGNFTNLTYLSLEANQLSGTIPEELGKLVNLTELILSSNQFVGSLPIALEKLTNLKNFRISDNSFNGTVPEFIGTWTKLDRLEMYSSGLEGPIDQSIFALQNLTDLRITDMIGPKFDFPKLSSKNMKKLVLRNLNMSGSILADIWNMGDLKTLDLTFNKLEGQISGIPLKALKYIFLSGNMLNGTIDSIIGTKENL